MSVREAAERGSKVTAEQIRSFGGCKKCNCWKIFCEHARHIGPVPVLIDGEWYWGDKPPVEAPAECKDCGNILVFSCREMGTGFCHPCAHKRYLRLTDPTPITADWLLSIGFTKSWVSCEIYSSDQYTSPAAKKHSDQASRAQPARIQRIEYFGIDGWEIGHSNQFGVATWQEIYGQKTRGQLRMLAESLGIPLNESEKE